MLFRSEGMGRNMDMGMDCEMRKRGRFTNEKRRARARRDGAGRISSEAARTPHACARGRRCRRAGGPTRTVQKHRLCVCRKQVRGRASCSEANNNESTDVDDDKDDGDDVSMCVRGEQEKRKVK